MSAPSPPPTIKMMDATDLRRGFLEVLSALSPTGLTYEQAVEVFRRRMRSRVFTYVALCEGRVIGTASLLVEPKFLHGGGVVGHIEDVAVHADHQHHGVGVKLVEHLLQVCRDRKCYKVILNCEEHVVPFYEKLGFRRWQQTMRLDLD